MSRGLGARQRQFIGALSALEAKHGARFFYVWDVLGAVWAAGFEAEHTDRKATTDAEWTRRKEYEAARLTEMKVKAGTGDADAKAYVERQDLIQFLGDAIRCGRRRGPGRREWRGAPKRRPAAEYLESMLNPSRIAAELQKRGLIERAGLRGLRGPGARIRLTTAGREAAKGLAQHSSDT